MFQYITNDIFLHIGFDRTEKTDLFQCNGRKTAYCFRFDRTEKTDLFQLREAIAAQRIRFDRTEKTDLFQ